MISQLIRTLISAEQVTAGESSAFGRGSATGDLVPGSTSLNLTFRRHQPARVRGVELGSDGGAATRMKEAASSQPMSVIVMPNSPNSFVARVISSGM